MTKQEKAQWIADCAETIANHYRVAPTALFDVHASHSHAVQNARNVLIFHLYRNGMSYNSIGRVVKRSVDYVRRGEKRGAARLLSPDKWMIGKLPSAELVATNAGGMARGLAAQDSDNTIEIDG